MIQDYSNSFGGSGCIQSDRAEQMTPALGVAPFLNERNGGTPGISERTFLLDPPLVEAGEMKTKGEQNMKTNYDRADAD